MAERTEREELSRDHQSRIKAWTPPQILPDPNPQPGYVFRWIRTALLGVPDNMNVSRQFREGWVAVRAEDHPEIAMVSDRNSQFKGGIEIGGLLLCKMPKEISDQRLAYYEKLAQSQVAAMEHNMMRESDPRMPLLKPERRTVVTFGRNRE